MEFLLTAARHALRRIRRNPLYAAVLIACLALGIGANTAIFSVVNSLLLQPLPVPDVEKVVFTLDLREEDDPFEASVLDFLAFREEGSTFSSVGLARRRSFDLRTDTEPVRVEGARITFDYLQTLEVDPLHGRPISAEDDRPNAPPVALIGHGLWQRQFGGDLAALGQTLQLNDRAPTIIGIMPPGFDLPVGTELWVPLAANFEAASLAAKDAHDYHVIARLRDGVDLEQANATARGISERFAAEYPDLRSGWSIRLISLRQQLMGDVRGEVEPTLRLVLGVVAFLLLIACANVASLLLVRSLERTREVALRLALGAKRAQLATQLLVEAVILSLLGGCAGLLVALALTRPLMALNPVNAYALRGIFYDVPLDAKVLTFTLGVSLLTGILFGLVPALRVTRQVDLVPELREGGGGASGSRRSGRLLDAIVVAEIAVAATLLVGAGLLGRSFQRLQDVPLGFEPQNVLIADLYLTQEKFRQPGRRPAFVEELLTRVRVLPGVESAGVTTNVPLAQEPQDLSYTVEGAPPPEANRVPIGSHRVVTPGYLEAMGMTLLQGRLIEAQDHLGSVRVMVVSEALAREAFGETDPIGRRIRLALPPSEDQEPFTIVGLVANVKEDRFNFRLDRPTWYVSYEQLPQPFPIALAVKTTGDPLSLAPSIRQTVAAIDPEQPVARLSTMDETLGTFLGPARFSVILVGLFAGLGLVLAAIGLYGVMTYSVGRRRREMGIRIALGALGPELIRLVMVRGLVLALIGLGLGLVASTLLSRWLANLLFEVATHDPRTYFAISLVLLGAAGLATFLPARRATRVDPVKTLRAE